MHPLISYGRSASLRHAMAVSLASLSLVSVASAVDAPTQAVGKFQGYVKNLTDEFVVNGLTGGNGTRLAELPPGYQRTWGIAVNYRID
jgi:hypothetical protein